MKINLLITQKNILQVLVLIAIGFICDAFIFATISTSYIPETGWGEQHYTKIVTLYRHFFEQYLSYYTSILTLIISTAFLFLFKILLFPKIIISIESVKDKTRCSEIIKKIHKNKNSLFYCFIIFCGLSFIFLNGYSDIYGLNYKYTYLLVIPIHYLVLYLYWQYSDTRTSNLNNIPNNYNKSIANVELIKYILITNPFFILISWFSLLSKLLNKFQLFESLIIVIFTLFIISLALFYFYIIIKILFKFMRESITKMKELNLALRRKNFRNSKYKLNNQK